MGINDRFKALADPTRREILRLLRGGSLSAGEIAANFELAASTMSGHFAALREAGLIVSERHGTSIVYSLSASVLDEIITELMSLSQSRSGTSERSPRE